MPRSSPITTSFNAGEFSPVMESRVDIPKYASACKRLDNFFPMVQGPAVRRGGFRFIGEVKNSAQRTWLVRFEFSRTDSYQLEFGNQYIRFWKNRQLITVNPPAWSAATNYVPGDLVTQAGTAYYCIAAHINQVPPNATFWYPLTAGILEIPTPWTTANLNDNGLFNLRFVQSADVVYICHGSYAPRKLSRFSDTQWTIAAVTPVGGPFQPENITSTTVYASAETGSVTLTASTGVFQAGHVGSIFYLGQKSVVDVKQWEAGKAVAINDLRRSNGVNYKALAAGTTGGNRPVHSFGAIFDGDPGVQWQYQDPGYGAVLITGFTSSTVVTGTVVAMSSAATTPRLPNNAVGVANASTRWAFGAWSDVDGWPTQVTFFRERLCFARDQTVWLSVAGDYEVFNGRDDLGLIVADSAISATLLSQQVNDIQWIEPLNSSVEALVAGTAGSEFVIKSQTENEPFGPANSTAAIISTLGSKNIRPVHVKSVLLFIQKSGTKMHDVSYEFTSNGYASQDQSILAEHLLKPGIDEIVYQREPYSLVWARRTDGRLICMTYQREQYPDPPHGGWHRHSLAGGAFVESLSVIPSIDGTRDELWAIIRYTISGATKRYICVMEREFQDNDDPEDSFYVDAGVTRTRLQNGVLTVPAGADVDGATGLHFTCPSSLFSVVGGVVGKRITYRFSMTDADGTVTYQTASARITQFISLNEVVCTIENPFPTGLTSIAANGWSLTQNQVSSLSHLNGQTVDILVDGATHPPLVVTGSTVDLQIDYAKVQIGLTAPAKLQTVRYNSGSADGTAQGKLARIEHLVVRLLNTLGMRFGPDFDTLEDVDFRTATDPMNEPPPIFSGDKSLSFRDFYDRGPWVCITQPYPLPMTVVALIPQVTAYDRG